MSTHALISTLTAFSHPTSVHVLQALSSGPADAAALSARLNLPPAVIAQHVQRLADAGLITQGERTKGRPPRLSLNSEAIANLATELQALAAPPLVSVVAKSGTGKTTFMEKLIPALKQQGLKIGVLKHHGHPTPFDIPGKDTYRHAQAGADVVVGVSAVQVAIFRQENGAADLDAVIGRHFAGLDLVLTEGYKRGSYPKIEVHRAARSHELLCEPEELLLLVTDEVWPLAVPQFGLEEAEAVAEWLVGWLQECT